MIEFKFSEKIPLDADLFLKLKNDPFPEWKQLFSVYRTNILIQANLSNLISLLTQ